MFLYGVYDRKFANADTDESSKQEENDVKTINECESFTSLVQNDTLSSEIMKWINNSTNNTYIFYVKRTLILKNLNNCHKIKQKEYFYIHEKKNALFSDVWKNLPSTNKLYIYGKTGLISLIKLHKFQNFTIILLFSKIENAFYNFNYHLEFPIISLFQCFIHFLS